MSHKVATYDVVRVMG